MKNQVNNEAVEAATSEAQNLLKTSLIELKNSTTKREGEEPLMFFPDGIQLISITVTVAQVKVELKVAGEKGIAGLIGEVEPTEIEDGVVAEEQSPE